MTQLDLYLQALSAEDGYREEAGGWTKFGQAYADRHNDQAFKDAAWCVMYVAEVARSCGISTDIIPDTASCRAVLNWAAQNNLRIGDVPAQRGDLVLYEWNPASNDGVDHIGVVAEVEGDTPDNQILYMWEGNWGDAVAHTTYRYRDSRVYAIIRPPYLPGEIEIKPPTAPENLPESEWIKAPFELEEGAEGREVQILQLALLIHGQDLGQAGMDGKFGPATRAAVEEFQKKRDLGVDGIVGTETWNALFVG